MAINSIEIEMKLDLTTLKKNLDSANKMVVTEMKRIYKDMNLKFNVDTGGIKSELGKMESEAKKTTKKINKEKVTPKMEIEDFKKKLQETELVARDTKKKIDATTKYEMMVEIDDYEQNIKKAQNYLKGLKQDSQEAQNLRLTIKDYKSKLGEAKRELNNYVNTGEKGLSRLQAKFNQISGGQIFTKMKMAWLGIAGAVGKAIQKFDEFAKVYEKQETAFAGVKKTTNATEAEFKKLEKELKKISQTIPKSFEELSAIAEVGGQMGISADNLAHFTDTVAKLSMSIAGIDATEAATQMARIMGLTKESISEIDRMGASLVELGNNYKATEGEILNFANNIAGTGAVVGMTSADILGIATAFVDVGVQAEAGGSAVMKVLLKINDAVVTSSDELNKFAEVAGMNVEEFARLWREDSAQAFTEFVKGLGEAGDDANRILGELIGTDIRLQRAFLAVAGNAEVLEKAIFDSNEAWRENKALMDEVAKRMETNEAKLKVNANRWENWKASLGKTFSDVKVKISDLFIKYGPLAFGILEGSLKTARYGMQYVFAMITGAITNLKNGIAYGVAFIKDQWAILTGVTKDLGNDMQAIFSDIPGVVLAMANSVIKTIEGLVNSAIGYLDKLIEMVNKVPGVNIGPIGPVDWKGIGNGQTFQELAGRKSTGKYDLKVKTNRQKVNEQISKDAQLYDNLMIEITKDMEKSLDSMRDRFQSTRDVSGAIAKTEEQIAKEVVDEQAEALKDLEDELNKLGSGGGGGGGGSGTKELTEAEKKAEEIRQKALEDIQKINDNVMLSEEEKREDIQKIREKADEEIKKLNMDEYEMELYLAEKASDNAKKLTEEQIKEQKKLLKDKAKAEIDAINQSTKSEKQKVDEINKIYEQLDEDLADLEKDDETRVRDNFEKRKKSIKELSNSMQEYYDNVVGEQEKIEKKLEDINDDIEKTQKNIEKIQTSIDDLGKDTSDKLASREAKIEEELNKLRQKYDGIEKMISISEDTLKRNLNSKFGNDITGEQILEYKKLYEELELIKKNSDLIMEESRNKAVESETERILREMEEKKAQYEEELALEQQKLEEFEKQKKEEQDIYDEFTRLRMEAEENLTDFIEKQTDDRIAEMEKMAEKAREIAEEMARLGFTGNGFSAKFTKTNADGTTTTETRVINYNTINQNLQVDNTLDAYHVGQAAVQGIENNQKGMSNKSVY